MTARLLIALFLVAQVCDGIFTFIAVNRFGVLAEGNPLLATWIAVVGPHLAITGAKLLAGACGLVLYCLGVHRILWALTLFYGIAAVGPWMIIFLQL